MNYGEELAYWYLRLNGFFPITNFVVHRSNDVVHRSDVDVLAVRMPFVYEEVGGRADDWDSYLTAHINFGRPIGLVCEVKTGDFDVECLFRQEQLAYTLPRLGLIPPAQLIDLLSSLSSRAGVEIPDGSTVAKLLVSSKEEPGPFFHRSVQQIMDFIEDRVQRYSIEKYASRMFFPSNLLQHVIDRVHKAKAQSGAA